MGGVSELEMDKANRFLDEMVLIDEARLRAKWIKEAIEEWDTFESDYPISFGSFIKGFVFWRWVVFGNMN